MILSGNKETKMLNQDSFKSIKHKQMKRNAMVGHFLNEANGIHKKVNQDRKWNR